MQSRQISEFIYNFVYYHRKLPEKMNWKMGKYQELNRGLVDPGPAAK